MPTRKHILFFLGAAAVMGIFLEALMRTPEQNWAAIMMRESRAVENKEVMPRHEQSTEEMRRAAEQQWNLAEHYYLNGDWDRAEAEYLRLKSQFPYTELDYGYRTDDASKRLREIAVMRRGDSAAAAEIAPNAPLSGD